MKKLIVLIAVIFISGTTAYAMNCNSGGGHGGSGGHMMDSGSNHMMDGNMNYQDSMNNKQRTNRAANQKNNSNNQMKGDHSQHNHGNGTGMTNRTTDSSEDFDSIFEDEVDGVYTN